MSHLHHRVLTVCTLLAWSLGNGGSGADPSIDLTEDWPQWRGPKEEVWRRSIGEGFSGLSIASSRVYTMYATESSEFVVSLNAADGSEVWKSRSGSKFMQTYGNGPRCTPTVDGGRVYALGANGELLALEAASGRTIWQHNLRTEFGRKLPAFGFTASPLMSLSPSGQLYWRYEWPTEFGQHPATPVFIAPDRVFISSGYGMGGAVLQMELAETGLGVSEVWFNKEMKNHISTSVYHEGAIYGFDDAIFKCIDAETGDERWKTRGYGKGTLIMADGHLIVLGDAGKLAIAEANPAAHVEVASAQVLSDQCWTAPSLAHGRLYLRNMVEIVCLDLAIKT